MRINAFSCEFGGATFITSSSDVGLKFRTYQSRASRKRGSRRMSYNRNIRLTCSCVTSPIASSWIFARSYSVAVTRLQLFVARRHFALQHHLMRMAQRNFRLLESQLDSAPQFPRHIVFPIQN